MSHDLNFIKLLTYMESLKSILHKHRRNCKIRIKLTICTFTSNYYTHLYMDGFVFDLHLCRLHSISTCLKGHFHLRHSITFFSIKVIAGN